MLRILLIEDDENSAALLNRFLFKGRPAEVTMRNNIDSALGVECDFAFLDLRLPPSYDERAIIPRIKELHCKVIILTAMTGDTLRDECYRAGAIGFFEKKDAIDHPETVWNLMEQMK